MRVVQEPRDSASAAGTTKDSDPRDFQRERARRRAPAGSICHRGVAADTPPDGRLVLVEFRKESAWVPIREEHKMSVKEARMELEAEGYGFDHVIDVLPWQHILVFRR